MKEYIKITLFIALLSLTLTIAGGSLADGSNIKRSSSGICHDPSSPYYDRIKNYDLYDSVHECLNPDGRIRKFDTYIPKYERNFFGSGWADTDKDGQNTRAETLIDQSTGQVHFRTDKNRIVDRGRWISIFTNDILTNADEVDVDHIFPLKAVWDAGAHSWDYEKRVAFANDPINLAAVEFALNRSKGAKTPLEWLPPENQCSYVIRYLRIGLKYKIKYPDDIHADMQDLKNRLCS